MIGVHVLASWSDEEYASDEDGKRNRSKTTMREELISMLREKEHTIKKLWAEMDYMKNKSKLSKKSIREIMKWSGEEINFSESINMMVVGMPTLDIVWTSTMM